MKTSGTLSIVVGSLLLLAGVASAAAADYSLRRAPAAHVTELPFPRSWRAQSVWASDACWADCGPHCTWGIAVCLEHDNQGHCLKLGTRATATVSASAAPMVGRWCRTFLIFEAGGGRRL